MRRFFAGLGVLSALLLVFTASFLVNVAADIERHRGEYGTLTIEITRELSRSWRLTGIEHYYVADARAELEPVLGMALADLKHLGILLAADGVKVEAYWSRQPWREAASPSEAAERLAGLIGRRIKVSFTGEFAGGLADVTAELRREGGRMKLWRLRVDSRGTAPPLEYPAPRVVSHA